MEIHEYLEKKKSVECALLDYIGDGSHAHYQRIIKLKIFLKIDDNPREMKPVLQMINSISENHHRTPEFFNRIEKILLRYYPNIKQTLSNKNELDISKFNKRILLFLIQEGFATIDDCHDRSLSFVSFFYPELESTLSHNLREKLKEKYEELSGKINLKKFNEFRKIGENNSPVCILIRNDSIEEFTEFVSKEKIELSSKIQPSIFETNSLLFDKEVSLIEYAAFFGSIQIFKYLLSNNVELNSSIWKFAIHSNNLEILQILKEKNVGFVKNSIEKKQDSLLKIPHILSPYYINEKAIKKLLVESIKCHHYEVFNYLKENLINSEKKTELDDDYRFKDFVIDGDKDIYPFIFKSYNYNIFPSEIDNQTLLFYLCAYDYTSFVELLLKNEDIDVNAIIISKYVRLMKFIDLFKSSFYFEKLNKISHQKCFNDVSLHNIFK